MARSVLVRKIAFLGVSGSKAKRKKPIPDVIAPRMRKRSCQLVTVLDSMLPIPQETTPPTRVEIQLPKNQAD